LDFGSTFQYRVQDAIEKNDRIIILFDALDFPKDAQANNLMCFTKDGSLMWKAEHPTNETEDSYTQIMIKEGLQAFSFGGYTVELDEDAGKILRKFFTK